MEAETRHDVQSELSPLCPAHLPAMGRVRRSPNLTCGSKERLVKQDGIALSLRGHYGNGCIFLSLTQHFPRCAPVLVTCTTVFKQRWHGTVIRLARGF